MVDLSQKRNITVYILLKQKFPNNIRKRIPASSHDKIIFINTVGEIYCNGEKTLSLFDLLELHLDKFMTNLKAVKEVIGCDFHAV